MHTYDTTFYHYINSGATHSAGVILRLLLKHLHIKSVADVGCGQAAWLAVWKELGTSKVVGIDGPYIDQGSLLIEPHEFRSHDLTQPLNLGESFDLVQSLEVAEHLPENAARGFVNSLVRHGKIVLFSAAAPGQGGENHVNEQPYDYWRSLFEEKGYRPVDAIRPHIKRDKSVEPWYRYNTLLYVNKTILNELPEELSRFAISSDHRIPDISPAPYKLRKLVLRVFPPIVYTWLAILKKHFFVLVKRPM